MADAKQTDIEAALESLRGASRGVGELAEVLSVIFARLRAVEKAQTLRRARGTGVAAATADPERAVVLQEQLEALDTRLMDVEATVGIQEDEIAQLDGDQEHAREWMTVQDSRVLTLETDAAQLQDRVSGLAPVGMLDAVGSRVTQLEAAQADERLRLLEMSVETLAAGEVVSGTRMDGIDDASTALGRRVQGAETRLAETRQQVAAVVSQVAALAEVPGRIDTVSHGLDGVEDRLRAVEADSVSHARNIGSVWESLTGLPKQVAVGAMRLEQVAADVSAQAAQAADVRLTLRGLAETDAVLRERLEAADKALTVQTTHTVLVDETVERLAGRVVTQDDRLTELATVHDGHATHVAALESTVKLLVDASGETAADDPRLRYMRHTGTPHAPDLYSVQGSQFQQDGVSKVVWRCRHCDYRHTQPVTGA